VFYTSDVGIFFLLVPYAMRPVGCRFMWEKKHCLLFAEIGLAVRNAAEVFGFKKIAGAPRTPESGEEIYRIWKIPVRTVPRHKRVRVFYVNLSPAPPRGLLTMEAINSSRVSVCAHQALCSWGESYFGHYSC
jgi:hypothetical protein